MRRWIVAIVLGLQVSLLPWSVIAAAEPTVVASGLNAPRGLAFGPDGALFIAEAGTGGDQRIEWAPPFGFAMFGDTGRILRVANGQVTPVVTGIQSLALGPGREIVGVSGLAFLGPTLYAVIGQANPLMEAGPTNSLLVRVEGDGSLETVANLGAFERANNPAGDHVDSNPFDLTAGPDGNLYVADAGGNFVARVTPTGEVSTVHAWPDNPVPTSVTLDTSGQPVVGFLSGFPFTRGSASVERVTPTGSVELLPNLTTVVDATYGPDGALYVLELASAGFTLEPPPPSFVPNSGRILRVTPESTAEVHGGLNFPTKMAFGPDGMLYVTNNATFVPPNSGQVLRIDVAPPVEPRAPRARDGQSLVTQSAATRAMFEAVWGPRAGERWVEEHNAELARQGR